MEFSESNTLTFLLFVSSFFIMLLGCGFLLLTRFHRYHILTYLFAAFIFFMEAVGISFMIYDAIFGGDLTKPFTDLLVPFHLIWALPMLFVLDAYIIELKKPGWLNWKNALLSMCPVLAFVLTLIIIPAEYTTLSSFSDIRMNISKPDVILRLALALFYIANGVLVLLIPKDKDVTFLSKRLYRTILILTSIVPFTFLFGLNLNIFPVGILHNILLISLDGLILLTEMKIRIPAKSTATAEKKAVETGPHPYFDNPEIWMNPDISASALARMMGTNQKYLAEKIKAGGYANFSDMINRKRVEYICDRLGAKDKGDRLDIIQLMYDAGFRSRSSASSEFKRIVGVSPSEYVKRMK